MVALCLCLRHGLLHQKILVKFQVVKGIRDDVLILFIHSHDDIHQLYSRSETDVIKINFIDGVDQLYVCLRPGDSNGLLRPIRLLYESVVSRT